MFPASWWPAGFPPLYLCLSEVLMNSRLMAAAAHLLKHLCVTLTVLQGVFPANRLRVSFWASIFALTVWVLAPAAGAGEVQPVKFRLSSRLSLVGVQEVVYKVSLRLLLSVRWHGATVIKRGSNRDHVGSGNLEAQVKELWDFVQIQRWNPAVPPKQTLNT